MCNLLNTGQLSWRKILAFGLISALFCSTPAMADMNRTTKGALLGAGVGLLTGNGVNGVLKGAAVGAGVGAVTEKGRDGKMRVKVQKWVPPLVLSLAFWPAMASKGRLKVPWLAVRVVQFWVKWNKEWWWKNLLYWRVCLFSHQWLGAGLQY